MRHLDMPSPFKKMTRGNSCFNECVDVIIKFFSENQVAYTSLRGNLIGLPRKQGRLQGESEGPDTPFKQFSNTLYFPKKIICQCGI